MVNWSTPRMRSAQSCQGCKKHVVAKGRKAQCCSLNALSYCHAIKGALAALPAMHTISGHACMRKCYEKFSKSVRVDRPRF